MGVLDFLKGKKRESAFGAGELEIPSAPPTAEELPELPSPKDIRKMEIKRAVERPPISMIEKIEREAVKEEETELEARETLELKKPIFMPLESFKELVEESGMIMQILKENEDTLVRVSQFKEDEDVEFKRWDSVLTDMQKKMIYADKTLFGTSE